MSLVQRAVFRWRITGGVSQLVRRTVWRFLGARIGHGTQTPPGMIMNWPHQVTIGSRCVLEENIAFMVTLPWEPPRNAIHIGDRVFIGRNCEFNVCGSVVVGDDALIASGCKFIDHNHGFERGVPMNRQPNVTAPIVIEQDVWLGANVVVLKGVTVGTGAIVGAGAVVTKSVPPGEIWAGIPARKIGDRPAAGEAKL